MAYIAVPERLTGKYCLIKRTEKTGIPVMTQGNLTKKEADKLALELSAPEWTKKVVDKA